MRLMLAFVVLAALAVPAHEYPQSQLGADRAIAGQARLAVSSVDTRIAAGVVGKRWFPEARVLLLAEANLQRHSFDDAIGPTRYQVAGYLGASKHVAHGVMVGAAQHWHPDVRLRSKRDAFELNAQNFPSAHLELHLLVRVGGEGDF